MQKEIIDNYFGVIPEKSNKQKNTLRAVLKVYEIDCGDVDIVVKENRKYSRGVEIQLGKKVKGNPVFGKFDLSTLQSICNAVDVVKTAADLIV